MISSNFEELHENGYDIGALKKEFEKIKKKDDDLAKQKAKVLSRAKLMTLVPITQTSDNMNQRLAA